ncbi:hypothetical protein P2H44_22730 [Albimonas sp. CAU 1670]|uniref:hypothetical protein n=1 Tax=Albimonas sp. CAU 1670 TaxID=3032599 RepID=UPI0023DB3C70|nr:hypothetical protein [Albimonas sp. CAU 1670]MDF2235381.1 hypothetical protein [Albimonas sp. CAU 1670]
MCLFNSAPKPIAAPIVPSTSSPEANREAAYARRMQQMRAGAAANILTSPSGIPASRPSNRQLGAA